MTSSNSQMLAPGSYAQWKSRFMRYVDIKYNRELLKKTIYEGPYVMNEVQLEDTLAIDDTPRQLGRIIEETYLNTTPDKKALIAAKAKATSSNTRNKNVDTSPRTRNDRQTGKFRNQMTRTVAGNRETIGNQEVLHATDDNSGSTFVIKPLENVQSDDEYNVFATGIHNSEQRESINDTYFMEKVNSNGNLDSSDMSTNEQEVD
ncbi:hypothetical protein Tco_0003444 [Tanacetum coccineum]